MRLAPRQARRGDGAVHGAGADPGEPVDARTDLFAFGILLYELLAGRRPFAGSTAMVVSSAILRESPEPLARVRADLPGDLDAS